MMTKPHQNRSFIEKSNANALVVTLLFYYVRKSCARNQCKKRNYPSNRNLLKTYYDKTTLKSKMKRKGCQRKKKYNELTPRKESYTFYPSKKNCLQTRNLEFK
jgi:hypothetical protein